MLPVLSMFFLTNPMAYTMGRFLPERRKAGVLRFGGQLLPPHHGDLPARQPGRAIRICRNRRGHHELDLPSADLAVRYFYVGLIVILMRGIVTDIVVGILMRRKDRQDVPADDAAPSPA